MRDLSQILERLEEKHGQQAESAAAEQSDPQDADALPEDTMDKEQNNE